MGRNNSGKTSLSDVIRKFLDERPRFNLEDFSSACYDGFCQALHAWITKKADPDIRALIPHIELRIHIAYDPAVAQYGPLAVFVIDFDVACDEAVVVCRYGLRAGAIKALFDGQDSVSFDTETETLNAHDRVSLFKVLRQRVPALFEATFTAEEPTDPTNVKSVSHAALRELMSTGFINAQRGVDGVTSRDVDVLAKVLEGLFASASLPTADGDPKSIAETLNGAVEGIQTAINDLFNRELTRLIPTIKEFGYPGLEGPDIQTETTLEISRLLSNHTKVQYAGYSGVHLPESYSGLGFRNLIFILLRIISFHREYQTAVTEPAVHLVFIEEPEAHLHPQMQEVFIRHLEQNPINLAHSLSP